MTDDTPQEMAQADYAEAQQEAGEAQTMFTLASGLDATAQVMDTLGFDETADGTHLAATAARMAGATDAIQALDWMTAATQWGTVADDLKQESEATGRLCRGRPRRQG
jgi:hypothetical protein